MLIKLYLQEAVQRAFLVAVVYIVLKGIYLAMMKKEVHIGKEILYCVTLTYMVTLLGYTMLPNMHMGIESSGKFYFICDRWGNGRINFMPFKTIGTFLFQSENASASSEQPLISTLPSPYSLLVSKLKAYVVASQLRPRSPVEMTMTYLFGPNA